MPDFTFASGVRRFDMYYQNIGELVDKGIMIGIGLFFFYKSFRPGNLRKKSISEAIQKKKNLFRICGAGMVICAILQLALFDWGKFQAEYRIRQINRQIAAIKQIEETMPPGDARSAEFIRGLKAIDTSNAPTEVKNAMSDCINSFEQLQQAAKTHQDIAPFIQVFTQDVKAFDDEMAKYQ